MTTETKTDPRIALLEKYDTILRAKYNNEWLLARTAGAFKSNPTPENLSAAVAAMAEHLVIEARLVDAANEAGVKYGKGLT